MPEIVNLQGEHWTITAVTLNAFTDDIDTPVHRNEYHLFRGMVAEKITGSIFFLENEHSGDAWVILADSPDYERAELVVRDYRAAVKTSGNVTVVSCKKGECEQVCRKTLGAEMFPGTPVTMSNTWGDGNGFRRVCEEFVLKEIDTAARLGVDVVQIDDGWQFGSTADPARRDERGRRVFADDFWQLDSSRFPRGMEYVSAYAAQRGVKLGLWFAPESKDHYACMERDIEILRKAYDRWGIRYFKLDMYRIEDDADSAQFRKFLEAIHSFGPDVALQLDVTRHSRVNYIWARRYGTVFVENRYAKKKTYFPHRTLKNLWLLAKYIPAANLQMELVNPQICADCYDAGDEFAAYRYDMEYLFACVMLTNPLLWMELQGLSAELGNALGEMLSFWQQYRQIFRESDVSPIGEKPTGRSFAGFYIAHKKDHYALLFREVTRKNRGVFLLPAAFSRAEILYTNGTADLQVCDHILTADFPEPRTFVFVKLNKNDS